jgi:hypothetical protein
MRFYRFRASGGAIAREECSGGLWVAPNPSMALNAISDYFFHLTVKIVVFGLFLGSM